MREFRIAERVVTDDSPALIVAEIGANHMGSVETCKAIFKSAAECGADAVKLQKRDNRTLYTKEMYDSPYHSENAFGPTYGTHREALEFDWDQYVELKWYAEELGLFFFATAFDIPSADFLDALGVPAFKIASGDLKNLSLIRYIAGLGKPMIISTGGGTIEDVLQAGITATEVPGMDVTKIAVLQCTAAYPVEPLEMNLRVIETYREHFPYTVIGLSDHQSGIAMGPVAYTLGARIFEKHFTLHHAWKGSDQAFSLEPSGLRRFVRDIHRTREALGDGIKRPYESEAPGLSRMAKSLVAARDLPAGYVLRPEDVLLKSPNTGLSPNKLNMLVGRRLKIALTKGQIITTSGIVE